MFDGKAGAYPSEAGLPEQTLWLITKIRKLRTKTVLFHWPQEKML
jgi:hypothetical protein